MNHFLSQQYYIFCHIKLINIHDLRMDDPMNYDKDKK